MNEYVKPEITVKEYRVSENIAALSEYYYQTGNAEEGNQVVVSLFLDNSAT